MREDLEEGAQRAVIGLPRAYPRPRQLGPRRLEELTEGHARGAGRLARPAAETEVEMPGETRREGRAALGRRPHEIDPPPWRVHLLLQHPVGRTLRQADSAMYARPERVDGLGIRQPPGLAHSPPTNRPGFRMPAGSNSALRRRMIASGSGATGPQTSTVSFTARGARSTTRLPPSGASAA